jgi:Spy/CpxP family protein refolding chaperone
MACVPGVFQQKIGNVGAVMTKAIVLATAVTAVFSLATPASAVTCDDVRALSPAQREYWAKRLGITSEQRQQIKAECFGGGRKSLRRHQQARSQ